MLCWRSTSFRCSLPKPFLLFLILLRQSSLFKEVRNFSKNPRPFSSTNKNWSSSVSLFGFKTLLGLTSETFFSQNFETLSSCLLVWPGCPICIMGQVQRVDHRRSWDTDNKTLRGLFRGTASSSEETRKCEEPAAGGKKFTLSDANRQLGRDWASSRQTGR